ncbi:MAG: LytR C-terminal domain-containing protein [Okeania sp. SIO2H7]|nr:LytR C-terminal domain-containing protein [Okeania sp. SIO2H7]
MPNILQLLREHIDTNLSSEELLSLLNFALDLEREQFRMVMLPGQFSQVDEYLASYWLMDKAAVDRIMDNYFQVRPQNLAAQLGLGRQEVNVNDLKSLRIVIQNASGDPVATQQLTDLLLTEGFTRVYRSLSWSAKDAENTQPTTQIIVQRGELQGAELVQDALAMGTVVSASIGDLHSDLTIRIGEDWPDFYDQLSKTE